MAEPTKVGDVMPPVVIYRVPKVCPACGLCYQGNSFAPPKPDAPPITHYCDACLNDREARVKGLLVPVRRTLPAQIDLLPPRDVGDAWEP